MAIRVADVHIKLIDVLATLTPDQVTALAQTPPGEIAARIARVNAPDPGSHTLTVTLHVDMPTDAEWEALLPVFQAMLAQRGYTIA